MFNHKVGDKITVISFRDGRRCYDGEILAIDRLEGVVAVLRHALVNVDIFIVEMELIKPLEVSNVRQS